MPFLDEQRWYEIHGERSPSSVQTPAIFLDRDGVIIVEKPYLRDPEEVALYPGAAETIGSLNRLGVPIVLVTNQSGIGRGLFGWADYERVHRRLLEILRMGGMDRPFTAVYANAHLPSETDASWRKPNPGMILQAAADMNLHLGSSILVGDKWSDIEAAARAGVGRLVHVRTGLGLSEEPLVVRDHPEAERIDSLADLNLNVLSEASGFK